MLLQWSSIWSEYTGPQVYPWSHTWFKVWHEISVSSDDCWPRCLAPLCWELWGMGWNSSTATCGTENLFSDLAVLGVLSPFLPIMLFSRNKRCSELHWAVIQWEGAVEDVLEDQGQVGTGLWRCLCSWQEGVGTRWFLRYLPTQTIPQFGGSLLWCFLESSVWVLWHTQRPEPEEQSWKPLEVGSAVGQDSSSTELAMSLPSHCCPAASHSSSPMAWRACSMCSNTRSISRMGFVPPGWKRSLLWI